MYVSPLTVIQIIAVVVPQSHRFSSPHSAAAFAASDGDKKSRLSRLNRRPRDRRHRHVFCCSFILLSTFNVCVLCFVCLSLF